MAVMYLDEALAHIRAGKADIRLLDGIRVDSYGSMVPINNVAAVNTPDARSIAIKPWDKNMFRVIEKAIIDSELGIMPENNGEIIRIGIPPLTEERRKQLAKQCKSECETAKVSVRNARRDAIDALKKAVKDGMAEDDWEGWKMLTDAGKTLGFRGGKAQRSWELIQALNARESTLNALYDFRPLISPEGWLPPVIDEAQDVAHITPDQIRTSSRVWTIIRPERFVSNPPGWRDWLLRGLSTTATPGTEGSVVPEDSLQRKVWETALRQGWQEGRQNADLTLEANQKTLTRDYRGMMLYSLLWRQGMITRPDVSDQMQTVTGDGKKLVTGDRVRRLKNHAEFNLQKSHWRPLTGTEGGSR